MNLLKRILVAVFFIPVLLFIFYNGGYYLLSFLALLSILMNYELILIMKKKDISLSYLNLIFAPLLIFALSFEKYDLVSEVFEGENFLDPAAKDKETEIDIRV